MRWRLAGFLGVWLALAPGPSRAEAPDPDKVQRGRVAFDAGRESLQKGDLQGALAHFRTSLSLHASPGTLLNLASVEEKLGLFATAAGHYEEAVQLLPPADQRVRIARERMKAIEPRIPTLSVQLQSTAPPGLIVSLDGKEIAAFATAGDIRADPGSHVLLMRAPGHQERRVDMTLQAGDRQTILVPPLTPIAEPPAPVTTSTPAPAPAPAPVKAVASSPAATAPRKAEEQPVSGSGSALRIAGFVTLDIGGVAAVVGAVTGGLSLGRKQELADLCTPQPPHTCSPAAAPILAEGEALAHASTAAFVVAGVALATGVTLFLVAPARTPAPPSAKVALTPGGLLVSGRF